MRVLFWMPAGDSAAHTTATALAAALAAGGVGISWATADRDPTEPISGVVAAVTAVALADAEIAALAAHAPEASLIIADARNAPRIGLTQRSREQSDAPLSEVVVDHVEAAAAVIRQMLEREQAARALELPEGTVDLNSRFYVIRDTDQIGREAVARQGVTITIKGPRQMGKSSLLLRLAAAARAQGKIVTLIDLQLVDSAALASAESFLRLLCASLSYHLKLPDSTDTYWRIPLSDGSQG